MNGYGKSKYYSEKVLWEFYEANKNKIEVITVLPSFVVGQVIGKSNLSSMGVIGEFFRGEVAGYPEKTSHIPTVEIRDVALIHILALESSKAAGKRFIAHGSIVSSKRILELLKNEFEKYGYQVPYKQVTNEELAKNKNFGSGFSLQMAGRRQDFDHSETENLLGFKFVNTEKAILDGAYSLIKLGYVENKISK